MKKFKIDVEKLQDHSEVISLLGVDHGVVEYVATIGVPVLHTSIESSPPTLSF